MTALAGLWRFNGKQDAAADCARMLAAQELYGPDGQAQWSDGGITLGRRLMHVLPEDVFDRQPLLGCDGHYVLIADIRLDNRNELISELQLSSQQVREACDATILLAAIDRWQENCLKHLIGDYAFALWDAGKRRLLLARDPLGQRPLHYHCGKGFFAFASMPKGLHALAEIPCVPDEEHVAEFLAAMPEMDARSFFRGVTRVRPGHAVFVTANGLATWRHWQPKQHLIKFKRPDEYAEALRGLLDQAVRCRLRGAKDVGAHLSGGFDSSAVAATAARLLAPLGRKVITFTAVPRQGYDGPCPPGATINEGPYASATAVLYPNMEHVLVHSEGPLLDVLDRNFYYFDEPVAGISNAHWANSICDTARKRGLRVVLSGGAGNFGLSYDGLTLLPELLCNGHWFRLLREGRELVTQGYLSWRQVLVRTFGPWCPAPLWAWIDRVRTGGVSDITVYSAINPRRLAELNIFARAKANDFDLNYRPPKNTMAIRLPFLLGWYDIGNYNKGVLGGWQIDERDPLTDIRLLEFCFSVPTEQFLREGTPRALAIRTLADRLPREVLLNRGYQIQSADWHEELTASRDRVMAELDKLEACPPAGDLIDLPRLRQLVENWPSAGWERGAIRTSYRSALLRGISAGYFLRRTMGGDC